MAPPVDVVNTVIFPPHMFPDHLILLIEPVHIHIADFSPAALHVPGPAADGREILLLREIKKRRPSAFKHQIHPVPVRAKHPSSVMPPCPVAGFRHREAESPAQNLTVFKSHTQHFPENTHRMVTVNGGHVHIGNIPQQPRTGQPDHGRIIRLKEILLRHLYISAEPHLLLPQFIQLIHVFPRRRLAEHRNFLLHQPDNPVLHHRPGHTQKNKIRLIPQCLLKAAHCRNPRLLPDLRRPLPASGHNGSDLKFLRNHPRRPQIKLRPPAISYDGKSCFHAVTSLQTDTFLRHYPRITLIHPHAISTNQ